MFLWDNNKKYAKQKQLTICHKKIMIVDNLSFFPQYCVMSKKIKKETPEKWERIFESEETISIWKYDSKISQINPYEVEIKYKPVRVSKPKK
jgi:hypothetical protein